MMQSIAFADQLLLVLQEDQARKHPELPLAGLVSSEITLFYLELKLCFWLLLNV